MALDMQQAETLRYALIQNILDIIQNNAAEVSVPHDFNVGKRLSVSGSTLHIGKKSFEAYEIGKFTVNTEGSMALYDRYGKKICGTFGLNVSLKNIDIFCKWIKKNNVSAEVVSGKAERIFQYIFMFVGIAVIVLIKVLGKFG